MKKTAVLLYPQFSEYELSVALSVLMQGEKPVITVSLDKSPIKGESGLSCIPDKSFEDLNTDEIDSLLLPGCMDINSLQNKEKYSEFINQASKREWVIASISSSPMLLAEAGVLVGRKYTVGLIKEFMEESGVFEMENYSDELVVQDGNIITARGRGFIRFGCCLGSALGLEFDERWYRE
ncbi:DJ-1/PfpI family protein [Heyndrickxia sp. MSNUG]|uniref:DJ-1/PfpI family protein n=1 Tax=Heyndrickxia sp. MSNUG TaxID=3136677 RepID=UPI003C2EFDAB